MEKKKSFVLYADFAETAHKLSNEDAGKLFKMILDHANGEDTTTDNLLLEIAFSPIKSQMDRDAEKWLKTREARSAAGKKGGRPSKQSEAKEAIALFDKQSKAKKAVTVTDTVTVNENVIILFERAWSDYGKKGSKKTALTYWKKLNDQQRSEIIEKIPRYVADQEHPQFQKDFQGWINPANELWKNKLKSDFTKHPTLKLTQKTEW